MTNKKTRELPQHGGSFKRTGAGLKLADPSTKEAAPYHERGKAASKTPAAKAPKTKPAKAAKSKGKSGGAATASVEQNTGTGGDAGGSAN